MRITNNMLINNMMGYLSNNLTRMSRYQSQLATGKVISVPSDDPVVAARALRLRTDVAEVKQFHRNTTDASSWMELTESVLTDITAILHRAKELTVQTANGTNTPDDLQKAAAETEQLKKQIINLANSTYAGRYIFSGFKTDRALMNDDGSFAIDVISSEAIEYEIGIGDDININVPGGNIFNHGMDAAGPAAATSGKAAGNIDISASFPVTITIGTNDTLDITVDGEAVTATITDGTYDTIEDLAEEVQNAVNTATGTAADITVEAEDGRLIFTSGSTGNSSSIVIEVTSSAAGALGLTAVTQTDGTDAAPGQKGRLIQDFEDLQQALESGDADALQSLLQKFDEDLANILRVRADVGARTNRLELTLNRLETDVINFTKLMSLNEDVDIAETIMNLTNEENVYNASLASGARIIMPSLVDFLR